MRQESPLTAALSAAREASMKKHENNWEKQGEGQRDRSTEIKGGHTGTCGMK